MPDDNRTQRPSNDAPRDPLDDLIAPILGRDVTAEPRNVPTRPETSKQGPRNPLDDLVTDAELRAEASKAAARSVALDQGRRNPLDDLVRDAELRTQSHKSPATSKPVQVHGEVSVFVIAGLLLLLFGMMTGFGSKRTELAPPAFVSKRESTVSPTKIVPTVVGKSKDNAPHWLDDFEMVGPVTITNSDVGGIEPANPRVDNRRQVERKPQPPAQKLTPEELYEKVSPSVVRVNVRNERSELVGHGSGFFVRGGFTVVTNFHVIEGGHSAEVVLSDGTTLLQVKGVTAFDMQSDIAILDVIVREGRLLESQLLISPLDLGGDELPRVASKTYVIGAPEGFDNSASDGLVSAVREMDGRTWIQTTAPISSGSSGSPVFNELGLVIGVATKSRVAGQNLNFAVAARHLRSILPVGVNNVPIKLTELPSRKPPQRQAAAPAKPADPVKPKDGEDSLKDAQGHIAAGLMRRALQTLDDIPEENRGPRYWRVRATAFFSIAKYQDSAKCYSESLKLDNTHSDTWIHYATTLHIDRENNEKNDDTILAACRAALKIDRNDARAYHMMGMTFHGREERIDAFKTALSLDEANLGTHYHLGCELAGVSRTNGEASKHFKRALALIGTADRFQVIPNPSRSSRRLGYITGNKIDDYSDRGSFETFLRLQLAAVCEGEERFALCREVLKSEPKNHVAKELMGLIKYNPDIVAFPDLRAGSLSAGITGILVFPK